MQLITFTMDNSKQYIGILSGESAYKITLCEDMISLIEQFDLFLQEKEKWIEKLPYSLQDIILKSPIPIPRSIRDFYAFEQHVKTARAKRGLDMISQWYEFPVFYFSNHYSVIGPDEVVEKPTYDTMLDFELELACVIGKRGRNVTLEEADDMIFGYMIMNDWSARDIQREEMKVGLGPAKGKDFATSLGPILVTKDELHPYFRDGKYHLEMTASINGKIVSKGNVNSLYYSFQEMIVHASKNVTLYPGEVIGSGTVGTGCILELGTEVHPWLKSGDEVVLEITGLGTLRNWIV